MNSRSKAPSEVSPVVRESALWVGLVGGGVAWLLHFLAIYVISEFGCSSGWGRGTFLGVTVLAWLLLTVSGLMTAGSVWTLLVARRALGRIRARFPSEQSATLPELYMARAGIASGLLFTLIIVVESVPIFFYLQQC